MSDSGQRFQGPGPAPWTRKPDFRNYKRGSDEGYEENTIGKESSPAVWTSCHGIGLSAGSPVRVTILWFWKDNFILARQFALLVRLSPEAGGRDHNRIFAFVLRLGRISSLFPPRERKRGGDVCSFAGAGVLIDLAQRGIDANPVACITWAQEAFNRKG